MTVKTPGTTLTYGGTSIGEVSGVNGLSSPSNKIFIGSFADTVMKYRPGRRKAGELTLDVNFNPDDTGQTAIETAKQAGTAASTVLTLPEGDINTITFNARVIDFKYGAQDDDIFKGQIVFKLTSKPVRS